MTQTSEGLGEAERALQDERLDFDRVYGAFRGRVVAYASKLVGRQDADDVAQEVFLKVGRSLGQVEDQAKLAPWIYTVTLNTVRDLLRRRAARVPLVPLASGQGAQDEGPADPLAMLPDAVSLSPEERVARAEMVACYLDYVVHLPRDYYEVYALSELEDLSNEQIARRLGLSLGVVKIRLHRARARLYDDLRTHCQCYQSERGELMAVPKPSAPRTGRGRRRP